MKTIIRRMGAALAAFVVMAAPAAPALAADPIAPPPAENPLERYVARPDPAFAFEHVDTLLGDGWRAYVLKLTSQTWRSAAEVDRPVWTHWLTIIKPDRVLHDTALLYIGGGDTTDPAPKTVAERSLRLALETNSVVAELGQVPNQPLRFSDSPDVPRWEDDLIAHVQNKQIATGDPEWIVRMAMVKSAVRAMDAVQRFTLSPSAGSLRLRNFVVAGGSKRGWTTWLVGAVDPRVVAIMPVVIDVLNTQPVTRHHYEALGYFSPALQDYVNHGLIPDKIGSPDLLAARAFEDPYSYRRRPALKMPKFIINAAGDEFFLPDNSQFYWPGLPEEKRLRYVPNAKHNLAGSDAVDSMVAFYQAVLTGTPRPSYSWRKRRDGALVVRTKDSPREVNLWQAHNPAARDFRLDTLGPAYVKTPLSPQRNGDYVARVDPPASGYTAYFVELVYDGPGKHPFKFTTEVAVTPNRLPYRWTDALRRTGGTPEAREALTRPPAAE